ncbi:hypothetical protein B0H13DRAFT_1878904 [Mycena leptocephala]|nr:hypothetical protein B0H13DRAFT_1878904 [Mycena leptocephala]
MTQSDSGRSTSRTSPKIISEINGVTTLDNGQQYTTPPPGGFPNTQLAESVWRNTTVASRVALRSEPGPKAWMTSRPPPRRLSLPLVRSLEMRRSISSLPLRKELSTRGTIILFLYSIVLHGAGYPPPYQYLLVDGDDAAMSFLVALGVCSTPDITFLIEPFNVPLPSYIATLDGFACVDSQASNDAIAAAIMRQLMSLQHIVDFLLQNAKPHPNQAPTAIASDVINSLHVFSARMARNKTTFYSVWNMYVNPPNMPLDRWMQWCAMVRNLTFEVHRFGRGRPRTGDAQFKCTGCKSNDHPTGMCSLPSIPGWFGATLATLTADEKTFSDLDDGYHPSPGPSSSKGGRGRGAFRRNNQTRSFRGANGGHRPY